MPCARVNLSSCDYALPVTGVNDELGYLFQTCFIVIIESALCKAIQIKHSKGHLPPLRPENQGADDLTFRAAIASDVPWIRVDVGHDECLVRHKGIRANTSTPTRGSVNELTCRFAAEGPQEQSVKGIVGSRAVIHTNFWSRK